MTERRVMSNERPSSRCDISLIRHNNLNILCILSLNTILQGGPNQSRKISSAAQVIPGNSTNLARVID
jgi:hypothetical protein